MDLLQRMTTFVRIADAGSISKAARSLRLSVAMTSRHLRGLEDELGVSLVRRTTRQLALTEAGETFLARARGVLAEVEDAREAVRPGRGALGRVVVSMPVSFGLERVSPIFPALLEAHPRLHLDLRLEDRFVDLLGDGVDVAIRAGVPPPDSPFLVARKLARVERMLCASPAFLAEHGRPKQVEALATLPCIVQGTGPGRWTFETSAGPTVITVEGRLRTNNILAARDAARAGLGVARLPHWMVQDDLERGVLVRVLDDVRQPVIEVLGIHHRVARGSAAIRAVLDALEVELPRRTAMQPALAGQRGRAFDLV